MKFAQTLCVSLFLAITGGLATLAYSHPAAYGRLFVYAALLVIAGGILCVAYEAGFAHGRLEQWKASPDRINIPIVETPIPSWFTLLGYLLLGTIFLLWVMTQILASPVPGGDTDRQPAKHEQDARQVTGQ
jgi:hypothetical protein